MLQDNNMINMYNRDILMARFLSCAVKWLTLLVSHQQDELDSCCRLACWCVLGMQTVHCSKPTRMFTITKCFEASESKSDDLNSSNLREKLGKLQSKPMTVLIGKQISPSFPFSSRTFRIQSHKFTCVLYAQVNFTSTKKKCYTLRDCHGLLTLLCISVFEHYTEEQRLHYPNIQN